MRGTDVPSGQMNSKLGDSWIQTSFTCLWYQQNFPLQVAGLGRQREANQMEEQPLPFVWSPARTPFCIFPRVRADAGWSYIHPRGVSIAPDEKWYVRRPPVCDVISWDMPWSAAHLLAPLDYICLNFFPIHFFITWGKYPKYPLSYMIYSCSYSRSNSLPCGVALRYKPRSSADEKQLLLKLTQSQE